MQLCLTLQLQATNLDLLGYLQKIFSHACIQVFVIVCAHSTLMNSISLLHVTS